MLDKIKLWLSSVRDLQHLITICVHTDNEIVEGFVESRRVVRNRLVQASVNKLQITHTFLIFSCLRCEICSKCRFIDRDAEREPHRFRSEAPLSEAIKYKARL